jgi:hypothetical protein
MARIVDVEGITSEVVVDIRADVRFSAGGLDRELAVCKD